MKNLKIYAMLLAGVATLSSCSDDLTGSKGEGWIQLSGVSTDKSLSTETRAGEPVMAVDIVDAEGNTFVHADNWLDIKNESYLVKADNKYTVKAYTAGAEADAEGFDVDPYYEGSSEVTVEANQAQTVDVTCRLAQAKLSVNYCDEWKDFVQPEFYAEVVGTNVRFEEGDSRAAYLKAGRALTLRLNFTPKGKSYAISIEKKDIVLATEAATHYKVNVKLNTDGNGDITVKVDQTVHEYEVTLGVPVENNGIITAPINGDYSRVWGTSATLTGYVNEETTKPVQFMYALSGTEEWTTVDANKVGETAEYTAEITGLELGTAYDYKIVSGEMAGEVVTFTTEKYQAIPNLGFEDWAQSGKNWYPNAVADNKDHNDPLSYWATGNEGVTTAGKASSTVPSDDVRPESPGTKCAELCTYTNVMLAKSAAGNLFIGTFATNMKDPKNSPQFGQPYTGARPRKLSGWYKYTSMPINEGTWDNGTNITTDEANIYMRVWAADGTEIGFGEMVEKETVSEWKQFSFDITYTDTTKPAAKLTIVATSSRYGGEFSGKVVIGKVGADSRLWVDDFEIGY